MADGRGKRPPAEALVALRQRIDALPARSPERRALLESTAALYGISRPTLYRALQSQQRPGCVQTIETAMSRHKHLIGPKLRARSLPAQRGEVAIAVAALNTMIRTAKPASVRVA